MLNKREKSAIVLSSVIKDVTDYQSSLNLSNRLCTDLATKLSVDILNELGLIDVLDEDLAGDVMKYLHETNVISNNIFKSIKFPYKNS